MSNSPSDGRFGHNVASTLLARSTRPGTSRKPPPVSWCEELHKLSNTALKLLERSGEYSGTHIGTSACLRRPQRLSGLTCPIGFLINCPCTLSHPRTHAPTHRLGVANRREIFRLVGGVFIRSWSKWIVEANLRSRPPYGAQYATTGLPRRRSSCQPGSFHRPLSMPQINSARHAPSAEA